VQVGVCGEHNRDGYRQSRLIKGAQHFKATEGFQSMMYIEFMLNSC
jgi:hypothetical protein